MSAKLYELFSITLEILGFFFVTTDLWGAERLRELENAHHWLPRNFVRFPWIEGQRREGL
jgi:hypothetical protein